MGKRKSQSLYKAKGIRERVFSLGPFLEEKKKKKKNTPGKCYIIFKINIKERELISLSLSEMKN